MEIFKLSKEEANIVLDCYMDMQDNIFIEKDINKAYSCLLNVPEEAFQRFKVQAINRYAMFNIDLLEAIAYGPEFVDIPNNIEKEMQNIEAINKIEQELYMETQVVNNQTGEKKKVGKTITRPKRTSTIKKRIKK